MNLSLLEVIEFPNRKIGIIGTGALASFYAAKLSVSNDVFIWGSWEEHIIAVNNSLVVIEPTGVKEFKEIKALQLNEVLPSCDLYIWLTKTYQNEERIKLFKEIYNGKPLLLLQNGISQLTSFQKELSSENVYEGITMQGAKITEVGQVKDTGRGAVIGHQLFSEAFTKANIPYTINENVAAIKNRKLALNAVINPLAAIYQVENGRLLDAELNEHLQKVMAEVYPYFKRRNVYKDFEAYIADVNTILSSTASNTNSMLVDVQSGRVTEIDSILKPIQEELNSELLHDLIHSVKCLKQTV